MAAEASRSQPSWQVSGVTGRDGSLSPVKKIISVNEHGLVFQSSKPFEICSELALGLHIARLRIPGTRFLNVSGFVVCCEPVQATTAVESGRGGNYGAGSYNVTIVFEHVGEEDRDLLRRICALDQSAPAANPRKFGELGLN